MQKHRLSTMQKIYLPFKRGIDIILSLIGCIILSPVLLIICIAIKVDSRGPILFKQKRVGIHKQLFPMLKFRTMYTDTPKDMPTHLLADPDRYITKVGRFLRKTSLDELPQIFNILKGDMSIIGPRPALWNQDDLVAERDKYGANDVDLACQDGRRLMAEMNWKFHIKQNWMENMYSEWDFYLISDVFLEHLFQCYAMMELWKVEPEN